MTEGRPFSHLAENQNFTEFSNRVEIFGWVKGLYFGKIGQFNKEFNN